MQQIFDLRQRIARIGSADWLGWWESNALTPAGAYALGKLFRRTPRLTAAHLGIRAARVRHDRAVPDEPLVHLFNFQEEFEGAFERWLIDRKGEGWEPPEVLKEPSDDAKSSGRSALEAVSLEAEEAINADLTNGHLVLGKVKRSQLDDMDSLHELAARLAVAYAAADPGRFVVPFFRIER